MYAHRYGGDWRPGRNSTDTLGDVVAHEMFGRSADGRVPVIATLDLLNYVSAQDAAFLDANAKGLRRALRAARGQLNPQAEAMARRHAEAIANWWFSNHGDDEFGQDAIELEVEYDDFRDDPEYQAWVAEMEANPQELTTSEEVGGLVAIATTAFLDQVKKYVPRVHSYDVRGGRDTTGQQYARVTLETTDPHGVLQKAAAYALQAAGTQGVSVTTQPSSVPGQIVLVFSQGAVPQPTP
jgi:hypothetical protein